MITRVITIAILYPFLMRMGYGFDYKKGASGLRLRLGLWSVQGPHALGLGLGIGLVSGLGLGLGLRGGDYFLRLHTPFSIVG